MKLLKGRRIIPKSARDITKVCEELEKDFTGAMRLLGRGGAEWYMADLLVDKGSIIAASIQRLGDKDEIPGDEALTEIRCRLSRIPGELEVYAFSCEDMNNATADNRAALLKFPISLPDFGVKIKVPVYEKPKTVPAASDGGGITGFFRRIFSGKKKPEARKTTPTPVEIRQTAELKEKPARLEKTPETALSVEVKPLAGDSKVPLIPVDLSTKTERLGELKERRMRLVKKIITEKDAAKESPTLEKYGDEGMKVETNIDRLFNLAQKHGRLKINDELAKKLGVTRTQLEEWAMILEEHNLLELHYPTIGEPEIKCSVKDKDHAEKQSEIKKLKDEK